MEDNTNNKSVLSFPKRLRQATDAWDRHMKAPLANRSTMLQKWASNFYESNAQYSKPHTMNMIDRGVSIIVPYLAMSNPGVMVNTKFPEYKHFAYSTQLALTHWLQEFRFAHNCIRPAVLHSMFGMGITKTGIMKEWEVEIKGLRHDVGQTYSDVVDETNLIMDPSARIIDEAHFMGDRYMMPTDMAKEFFDSKHADHIRSSYKLYGAGHPDEISKDGHQNDTSRFLKDYTRFRDYYLPDEQVILTLTDDDGYNRILNEVEWDGPESGPYDFLGYKWFLENSYPIPPAWGWLDMDTIINIIINKLRAQAESEKTVLAYESAASEDAERIANAGDRQTVKVDNIESLKPIEFSGINPEMYNWLQYIEGQYSLQGQNLYTIGGRNSQAETLGQEQMLMANASKSLDDMIDSVHAFVESILRKHAWYMWTDPLIDIPVIKKVPGFGDISERFVAPDREGEFYDYTFSVKPYSMQRMSPDVDFQRTLQFLAQWVLPTSQLAAQQGAVLNVPEATKDLAQKFNIQNIDHWYDQAKPLNAGLNPYSPDAGSSNGQQDGRTGMMGAGSRNINLQQQQGAAGGQSSPVGNNLADQKKANNA
jgi:hypothetical protein